MGSSSLCSSPGFCPPRRLLPAAAVVPEIPRKAAAGCERKLTLSFLPCAEFSFPGPDDSSWGKYEETLAESHDGSEGEESMEAPSTCELETSPRQRGRERRARAPGSGWGHSPRETLLSPRSLPASPRAQRGAGPQPLQTDGHGCRRSSETQAARLQKQLRGPQGGTGHPHGVGSLGEVEMGRSRRSAGTLRWR